MSEFLAAYGLFLAQLATFALLLVIVVVLVASLRRRGHAEGLVVEHLNRRFEDSADGLKLAIEGKGRYKKAMKARSKERKREDKSRAKERSSKPRLYVLDFKGDLRASARGFVARGGLGRAARREARRASAACGSRTPAAPSTSTASRLLSSRA